MLDPGRADLISEEIDVAIRIGTPDPTSPLIAKRLGETASYPFASPRYLERYGVPERVDELREHEGVFYRPGRGAPTFVLEGPDGAVRA